MNKSRQIIAAALLAVSVSASAAIPAFAKVNEYEGQHKINEYEGQHGFVVGDPSQWGAAKVSSRLF